MHYVNKDEEDFLNTFCFIFEIIGGVEIINNYGEKFPILDNTNTWKYECIQSFLKDKKVVDLHLFKHLPEKSFIFNKDYFDSKLYKEGYVKVGRIPDSTFKNSNPESLFFRLLNETTVCVNFKNEIIQKKDKCAKNKNQQTP